jgi:cytidyltransferase-like protein
MKTGVILARLQPIHNGHVELIKRSDVENDETYVFVGSADKFNKRNPIPISTRLELTKKSILEAILPDNYDLNASSDEINRALDNLNIHVIPLDDLDDESNNSHDWGFYLYSKVVTETGNPNFTLYYSDGYEIITSWFPGFILRNNVSLSLLARNSIEKGISATTVRKYIVEGNDDELKKVVPNAVFEKRDHLKTLIELSEKIH